MAALFFVMDALGYVWRIRGYCVFAVMLFLGFRYKKSKYVTVILCIYFWVLIALNTFTADYYAYEEMYLCAFEPRYIQHEIGYMLLCRICLVLGLSYRQFRMVVGLFIVICIYHGIRYYTDRMNYVLALYLIFPFLSVVSGLRNACCIAVMLVISRYLFGDKRYDTLKYIFGVAAAMMFHYSAGFYILFAAAKFSKSKNIRMLVQTCIFSVVVFLAAKLDLFYKVAVQFTNRQKTLQWLHFTPFFSPLYIVAMGILCIFLFVLYNAKLIERKRETMGINKCLVMDARKMEQISRVLIVSLIAFTGAIFRSVVFLRLILTMLPVGYAVCANAFISYCNEDVNTRFSCTAFRVLVPVFSVLVSIFVFGYWIGGDVFHVVVNNLLFL